jgi:hypothetical protein
VDRRKRPAVKNAADPVQVRKAKDRDDRDRQRLTLALEDVMRGYNGRLVLRTLLERAGCFRSVFHPNGVEMAYRAGKQDFGHMMQAEIVAASADSYEVMEREAHQRAIGADAEAEAAATAATEDETQ